MDKNNIVKMAVDSYNGRVQGNYSVADTQEALRNALIEANGGSSKLNYRNLRGGQGAELFALLEEIITKTVMEGLPESSPLFNFVEWRNLKEGDSNIFELEDDGTFVVADIAYGTQGLRRQRLVGGEEITIKPQLKGIKIYEELRRVLAGRVDFNKWIDKVSEAFKRKISEDAYDAVVAAFANLVAPYSNGTAGSFNETTLFDIIEHVEAATGKKATILGSKRAVRKITNVRGGDADSAKEDLYAMGYFGHFYTTPIVVLQNGHKVGSTNFILNDDLYVVAGDNKFIKGVTEGETLIIPGETLHNADLSQEYLMAQAYGLKAVVSEQMGVYLLS